MWSFFFSSRRRHTRWTGDWSSDVCSSDLTAAPVTRAYTGSRQVYDLVPHHHLEPGDLGVRPCPLCRRFPVASARLADASRVRRCGAVHRAVDCECRAAPQRGYAVLAAQHLLDADRVELHAMDDRAV